MVHRFRAVLLVIGVLVPSLAQAARFDFIYADQITMRAPLSGWGITLAGQDFGLIVNKGTASLGADELYAAVFSVEGVPVWPDTLSPMIDPHLMPGINSGYLYHPSFSPIQPDEAVGSVGSFNGVLTTLVGPGETFRNSSPAQFIYFEMGGTGNSPGIVRFNVHLLIGEDHVEFPIFVTLIDSPDYSIQFDHAARVSSVSGPTAAKRSTWGKVKKLYR